MKLEDLNNLDFNNVGNWPVAFKTIAVFILCAAVVGAAIYYDTTEQLARLDSNRRKEVELKATFEKEQINAAILPKLKEQLVEIEKNLLELQRRLPNQAEIAALIQDISQQVVASTLRQDLFKPGKEQRDSNGVYEKYPIQLKLRGNYHSFGKFISGISAMPRIVTLHEISIKPVTGGKKDEEKGQLTLEMTAQIYRYLEAGSEAEEDPKKGAKPPPASPPANKK
jgi:type IV pilus assembly protein PilO